MAAHLPGVIASMTPLPVIGVPIKSGMEGLDALLAIVQMPPGIPVATVGINASLNAAILATQMLALGDAAIAEKVERYKAGLTQKDRRRQRGAGRGQIQVQNQLIPIHAVRFYHGLLQLPSPGKQRRTHRRHAPRRGVPHTHTVDDQHLYARHPGQRGAVYPHHRGRGRLCAAHRPGGARGREPGRISRRGCMPGDTTPRWMADIHFNPKAADAAACTVEKVRINPGNFVDSARTFKQIDYTDEEYAAELTTPAGSALSPSSTSARQHHTAIRLGVNHGSLSDRIMSRYGDTPAGMVESCMEFLRICRDEHFDDVAISIKASNTVVMVADRAAAHQNNGGRGHVLPAASGGNRGRRRRGRTNQIGRGHRHPAGRRHRRHHQSLAERGSRGRGTGGPQAGRLHHGPGRTHSGRGSRPLARTAGRPTQSRLRRHRCRRTAGCHRRRDSRVGHKGRLLLHRTTGRPTMPPG